MRSMGSISERHEGSNPSGPTRYDVEIHYADGNEDRQRWVSLSEVLITFNALENGDDMMIHHVGFADPNVEYS